MKTTPKNGFTLIELMVTISIIAILATVSIAIFSTVQRNGRNAKRIQDMEAFRISLENYKTSIGKYPYTGTGIQQTSLCDNSLTNPNAIIPTTAGAFFPDFMATAPTDPLFNITQTNRSFCWIYLSNGTDYKLMFANANTTEIPAQIINSQPNLIDQLSSIAGVNIDGTCTGTKYTNRYWAIYSSVNSRCW